MNASRIAEIESELRAKMPYSADYDPGSATVILCDVCNGATDDHKAGCIVPLVYEMLSTVKKQIDNQSHGLARVESIVSEWFDPQVDPVSFFKMATDIRSLLTVND